MERARQQQTQHRQRSERAASGSSRNSNARGRAAEPTVVSRVCPSRVPLGPPIIRDHRVLSPTLFSHFPSSPDTSPFLFTRVQYRYPRDIPPTCILRQPLWNWAFLLSERLGPDCRKKDKVGSRIPPWSRIQRITGGGDALLLHLR